MEHHTPASYAIGFEDLDAPPSSVRALRDIVETVSRERVKTLKADAGFQPPADADRSLLIWRPFKASCYKPICAHQRRFIFLSHRRV